MHVQAVETSDCAAQTQSWHAALASGVTFCKQLVSGTLRWGRCAGVATAVALGSGSHVLTHTSTRTGMEPAGVYGSLPAATMGSFKMSLCGLEVDGDGPTCEGSAEGTC